MKNLIKTLLLILLPVIGFSQGAILTSETTASSNPETLLYWGHAEDIFTFEVGYGFSLKEANIFRARIGFHTSTEDLGVSLYPVFLNYFINRTEGIREDLPRYTTPVELYLWHRDPATTWKGGVVLRYEESKVNFGVRIAYRFNIRG